MAIQKKTIIVIVGATGNQGSSVAKTFLKLPTWHVRCTTRTPESPAAQSLRALGAEVVKADLSDPASLTAAFQNASAIFLNTDFWTTYRDPDTVVPEGMDRNAFAFGEEVAHGTHTALAALNIPTLKHFIYSSLPPMKKHSKGKYANAFHADSKATFVEYIEDEVPELAKKMSVIYLGAYDTNPMLTPRFDPSAGYYKFLLPLAKDTRMPIIDPKESTGPFVRALVEDEKAGTKLLAYDSILSMEEIATLWSKISGRKAEYVEVDVDDMHRKFGVPVETLDSGSFVSEFGYMGGVSGFIEPSQLKTKIETKSFEKWLEGKYRDKLTALFG